MQEDVAIWDFARQIIVVGIGDADDADVIAGHMCRQDSNESDKIGELRSIDTCKEELSPCQRCDKDLHLLVVSRWQWGKTGHAHGLPIAAM
jgi:hypothetical protein